MKQYKVTFSDGSTVVVEAGSGHDAETKVAAPGMTVVMVVLL